MVIWVILLCPENALVGGGLEKTFDLLFGGYVHPRVHTHIDIGVFACQKMSILGQDNLKDNQAEIVVLPPDKNLCAGELSDGRRGSSNRDGG